MRGTRAESVVETGCRGSNTPGLRAGAAASGGLGAATSEASAVARPQALVRSVLSVRLRSGAVAGTWSEGCAASARMLEPGNTSAVVSARALPGWHAGCAASELGSEPGSATVIWAMAAVRTSVRTGLEGSADPGLAATRSIASQEATQEVGCRLYLLGG